MATKIQSISGFPEWLPQEKLIEDQVIEIIREIYRSHGFVPVETPAVELLDTLQAKGIAAHELYEVRRLKAEEGEESKLGLHFDLTVPFARYVAQHFGKLVFPFKRYQLQKVWRGERPQKGRYREFYQFDIDIVNREDLPLSADAEILAVTAKVYEALPVGPFVIRINDRRILEGCYQSFGLSSEQISQAIIVVDKVDKIGVDGVRKELEDSVGVPSGVTQKILDISMKRISGTKIESGLRELSQLSAENENLQQGIEAVATLFSLLSDSARSRIVFDLSIARGLNYYTGLIAEVHLENYPEFGSCGGGGRYADLASNFTNQKLPGVGVSIGLSRLMGLILSENLIQQDRSAISQVLIAVYDEEQRKSCNELAEEFRRYSIPAEVFLKSPKLGKQIDYAAKLGIPYVAFLDAETQKLSIKDIRTGDQEEVDGIEQWATNLRSL